MKNEIKSKEFVIFEHLNIQYKVFKNEKITVPYNSELENGTEISFDKILMTEKKVGTPYLSNLKVIAKCVKNNYKDKKIIVFKYKSKKNYRVKTGHRQKWALVEIIDFQKTK